MKIWFNKNYSSIAFILAELQKKSDITTLLSHTNAVEYQKFADSFIYEPEHSYHYIEFCLQICEEHQIDVFYPWRNFAALYAHRQAFAELGVKTIFSCSEQDFYTLNNKAACYRQITARNLNINIPLFATANAKAEFIENYHLLRPKVQKLCMKPSVSVYGAGFKIIHDEPGYDSWQILLEGFDRFDIAYQHLLQILPDGFQKEIMLLDFLPGDEYSHDILCWEGEIIIGTIRQKHHMHEKYQTIIQNFEIERMSRLLVQLFNLNGFINIQYRDDQSGVPFLLEINPRISGGFPKIALTGIDYVGLFVKLLNQQPILATDIRQKLGLKVAEDIRYISLEF